MPTVTLPFLNDGKPIDPVVNVSDIEEYETAHEKAVSGPRLASNLLKARMTWLERILSQSPTYGSDAKPKLTAPQITQAFWAIWNATANGAPTDPLE